MAKSRDRRSPALVTFPVRQTKDGVAVALAGAAQAPSAPTPENAATGRPRPAEGESGRVRLHYVRRSEASATSAA